MWIQRENDPSGTSHHAPVLTFADADGGVHTGQPGLTLQVGSHLDPGVKRKHQPNEDTILVTQSVMPSASLSPTSFALLTVADGVGGQARGQEASWLAAQFVDGYVAGSLRLQQMMPAALLPLLIGSIQYANQLVYQHNRAQGDEMGTTLTATLVLESTAYVAHVGASRLYLHRAPAGLAQITRDHSVAAALLAAGIIGPGDTSTHPGRNQVYRSLGERPTVEVEASVVPLAAGDILLLCSDGLWKMVRDRQLAAILTTPLPGPWATAHALVRAALIGGGEDNVSAIVAQVGNI